LTADVFRHRVQVVHPIRYLQESMSAWLSLVDVVWPLALAGLFLGKSPIIPVVSEAEFLLNDPSPPDCMRFPAFVSAGEGQYRISELCRDPYLGLAYRKRCKWRIIVGR
jgi:hypothetical protein